MLSECGNASRILPLKIFSFLYLLQQGNLLLRPTFEGGERDGDLSFTEYRMQNAFFMYARACNVDLYHWSSAKFSSTWYDTLSVLVAKGRAQVGVAASSGDWPKRIRDMQYTDHEDYTMGS